MYKEPRFLETLARGNELMRKGAILQFSLLAALAIVMAGCGSTQSSPPASIPAETAAPPSAAPLGGIAAETVLTVHGKIVAVDTASKQVTLEGPNGKDLTLAVNNPYNLESLKAGDRYVAQFTESISIVG